MRLMFEILFAPGNSVNIEWMHIALSVEYAKLKILLISKEVMMSRIYLDTAEKVYNHNIFCPLNQF